MVAWHSLQPKMPWTLAECLAGSREMLLPLADASPGWPWQARHASSFFSAGEADANVEAKARARYTKAD